LDDFDSYELPQRLNRPLKLVFASSYAGKSALEYVSAKLNTVENLHTVVRPVKSNYWGKNITVAGLITSEDLINTVKDEECDYVVAPGVMLKPYTDLFLDGESLANVEKRLDKKFIIIKEQYSMGELFEFLDGFII